jgi:protein-S-isoprenylcysteine O-methyltransferase Ste14
VAHAPLVLAGLIVAVVGSVPLAKAWFVASRLAYVLFVGFSLRAESREGALSRREGPEAAWWRFQARAARLMVGDVIAFGALCMVTRGTFAIPGPPWYGLAAGILLVVLGVGTKAWATAHLAEGSFYWRDFFLPAEHRSRSVSGPYRWLSNPMYTVGYFHAYGFALLVGSSSGMGGAAFAQLAILLLAALVERPHVSRFGRP